jgi:hypothetical protein
MTSFKIRSFCSWNSPERVSCAATCSLAVPLVAGPVLALVSVLTARGVSAGLNADVDGGLVDDEKTCMLLVMRVLSIVPLNFKVSGLYFYLKRLQIGSDALFPQPQPWSAPLSRELLVFNSFVRSLTRALRTLLEVTTLNLLIRGDARRQRDDYLDIALSLPFQTEVNTGFGVLAKVYLDALTHINGGQRVRDANAEGVKERKQMALEICEETFPGVKSPAQEVERGFRFWDVVSLFGFFPLRTSGSLFCQTSEGEREL